MGRGIPDRPRWPEKAKGPQGAMGPSRKLEGALRVPPGIQRLPRPFCTLRTPRPASLHPRAAPRVRPRHRGYHLTFEPPNWTTSRALSFWSVHIASNASAWFALIQWTARRRRARSGGRWVSRSARLQVSTGVGVRKAQPGADAKVGRSAGTRAGQMVRTQTHMT